MKRYERLGAMILQHDDIDKTVALVLDPAPYLNSHVVVPSGVRTDDGESIYRIIKPHRKE